jgi:hypothetical protein
LYKEKALIKRNGQKGSKVPGWGRGVNAACRRPRT